MAEGTETNEVSEQSEAEKRFQDLARKLEGIPEEARAEALEELRSVAEEIEDEEKKQKAYAQLEQLKQGM